MLLTYAQTDDQFLYLNPGDAYFGGQPLELKTVLGSCVAVLLWHAELRMGGMCHYLLPSRIRNPLDNVPDGHYADEVLPWLLNNVLAKRTHPADYRVYLIGGATMFPLQDNAPLVSLLSTQQSPLILPKKELPKAMLVGKMNIEFAKKFLTESGFHIHAENIAGTEGRSVSLNLANGDCCLYHYQLRDNQIHKQVVAL